MVHQREKKFQTFKKNRKDLKNMNIEWEITEEESQQEMVSSDGRWHITKNQK